MTIFNNWLKLANAGAELAQAGVRTGQTFLAADSVIRSRTGTIASAMHNPLDADYAELGRMLPEKMIAVSEAISALMAESWKLWAGVGAQWQALSGMASGKPPANDAPGLDFILAGIGILHESRRYPDFFQQFLLGPRAQFRRGSSNLLDQLPQ